MFLTLKIHRIWYLLLLAFPLALLLLLISPKTSDAYAILLRSDPASDTVLKTGPAQVSMWFSEDLNPITCTASVVNAANQRMDVNGALIIPTNLRQMDVSLRPDLQPGVYVVSWHTQSARDGQVFNGTFLFSIATSSGVVPQTRDPVLGQSQTGNRVTDATIFRLLIAVLIDLCLVCWLGGQFWHLLIFDPAGAETTEQSEIEGHTQQRFARHFSLPILRILFLANSCVLLGQAFSLVDGRWDLALAPSLLIGLLTSGSFGLYWLISEIVIGLSLMLETFILFTRLYAQKNGSSNVWLEPLLGIALLVAITLSSATTVSNGVPDVTTLLVNGLYLLAAALWIGGIFYLSLVYLPVLKARSLTERALSLLTTRQRFVPFATSGMIIMVLSGTFNAIGHLATFDRLYTTFYGHLVIVQAVCVIVLLILGAMQVLLIQPDLAKAYKKYAGTGNNEKGEQGMEATSKLLEQDVVRRLNRFTVMLDWMVVVGIVVIFCAGIASIFT